MARTHPETHPEVKIVPTIDSTTEVEKTKTTDNNELGKRSTHDNMVVPEYWRVIKET